MWLQVAAGGLGRTVKTVLQLHRADCGGFERGQVNADRHVERIPETKRPRVACTRRHSLMHCSRFLQDWTQAGLHLLLGGRFLLRAMRDANPGVAEEEDGEEQNPAWREGFPKVAT